MKNKSIRKEKEEDEKETSECLCLYVFVYIKTSLLNVAFVNIYIYV